MISAKALYSVRPLAKAINGRSVHGRYSFGDYV